MGLNEIVLKTYLNLHKLNLTTNILNIRWVIELVSEQWGYLELDPQEFNSVAFLTTDNNIQLQLRTSKMGKYKNVFKILTSLISRRLELMRQITHKSNFKQH